MDPLVRTARQTGALYLGLAVTGMLGFLVLRPRLFEAADPVATLARLVEHDGLARGLVALELAIVLTQALAAAWFLRLFRAADPIGAGGIAAFGLVNATAILGSAAAVATAVDLASVPAGADAHTVHLLLRVSENAWRVGGLFFGLWLVPMGTCVLRSGWMPRALGWLLVAGGACYVLSTFATLAPGGRTVADILVLPPTVGEFWMIGYLLVRGVRAPQMA